MPTILCRYYDDHCYLSLSFWQTMPYEFRGTVGEITYKPLDFTKSASNGLKHQDSVCISFALSFEEKRWLLFQNLF